MAAVKVDLRILMDDGNTLYVTADQRDYARWETQPESGSITQSRFLGWSAAQRAKVYAGSWIEFNTVDCVQVDSPNDDDDDDDSPVTPDPGLPEVTAGS